MAFQSDIEQFLDEYGAALKEAAFQAAEEKNCDEMRKIVRSELVMQFEGPATKAEHYAQASQRYQDIANRLAEIRTKAAAAGAKAAFMSARLDVWRMRAAMKNTSMKQGAR